LFIPFLEIAMHTGTTLTQFIIEEQRRTAGATGDFTSLLNDVVTACKAISNVVNKGALQRMGRPPGRDGVGGNG
jgi:fructose-1,6-bisphosphatase I